MLRPDELSEALGRAAELAGRTEPPVEDLVRRARRRYRRKHAALPALAAACVVAVAVPITLVLSDQDEAPPPPPADAPVDPASDPRVPDEGDRVRATGTVQLLDGAPARLCVETGHGLSGLPPETPCPAGLDLLAFEPSAADGQRTTVEGVLRSGTIDVDRQSPEPAPTDTRPDFGPAVPCPAPPGGWPEGNVPYQDTGPDYAGWRDFKARHANLADRIFQLTANKGRSQVMTFLARDEAQRAQIHSELVALFGADRICSIVSPLDRTQGERLLQKVADAVTREPGSLASVTLRYEDGLTRQVVDVAVYAVTPELVKLQQQLPPGAVELHPFLVVVQ